MSEASDGSVSLDDVDVLRVAAVALVGDNAAALSRLYVASLATVLLDVLDSTDAAAKHAGTIGPALVEAVRAIGEARTAEARLANMVPEGTA